MVIYFLHNGLHSCPILCGQIGLVDQTKATAPEFLAECQIILQGGTDANVLSHNDCAGWPAGSLCYRLWHSVAAEQPASRNRPPRAIPLNTHNVICDEGESKSDQVSQTGNRGLQQ